MSDFSFAANITNPYPDANQLYDPVKAIQSRQAIQQNQLVQQGEQQQLNMAGADQVRQAAAGILSSSNDEGVRAQLYPRVVGLLQSQHLAMNAPAQYPGEATLRALVNSGLSAKDLYASGALLTPQQQQVFNTPTPPAGGGGTSTPAAGGGPAPFVGANLPQGVTPDEDQLVRTVYGEASGEPVAGQQAVASVIKTRMQKGSQGVQDTVFAPNQFEAWSDPKNRPRMEALSPTDPQYQAILNNVVRPVMSGQTQDPTGGATYFFNPKLQGQLGRGTPGFAQGNQTTIGNHTFYYGPYGARGGTATASAAPAPGATTASATPGQGVPGAVQAPPAPNQFAGPGAPPGAVAPPAAAPAQAPAQGDEFDVPQAAAPAQPPAAPAVPASAPAASASTSNLPEVSTIPSGYQSPGYQHGWALYSQGRRELQAAGSNPSFAQQAQADMAEGQRLMSLGSVVSAQQAGRPGEYDTITGKFTPWPALPSARSTTDTQGRTWILPPDNQPARVLSDNPSGVTGTGPEASAMRIIAEIGPKKAQGQTTPQEDADYNNAVIQHLQFKTFIDPATGALMRGPTVPLPPGMPLPDGISLKPEPVSGSPRGPDIAGNIATELGKGDVKGLVEARDAAMKSHDILGTTSTIRSVLPQVTTGTLAEQKLRASQILTSLGVDPQTAQQWTGTNAAPGEILQKKLFELSTGATRAMGAREPGSVMQMFQKNYPGMTSQNMTIDAMTRLIDMDQTYKEDEVAARGAHLSNAVQDVAAGKPCCRQPERLHTRQIRGCIRRRPWQLAACPSQPKRKGLS